MSTTTPNNTSNSTQPPVRRRGMMGGGGMGGGRRMMRGEKPRDFKGTMKKLIQYLGSYKFSILLVMLLAAGSTVLTILSPKILGKATTKLFEGVMNKISGTGSIDFAYIGEIILWVLGLYLAAAIFSYIQGWVMSGIAMKISYQFRKDISKKINRLPFKYFDGTSHGEVLSRVTNDVDTVSQTLNMSLSQIITSVTTVIGVLVMMFTINWQMTLIALLIIPISVAIISVVVRHSQVYFKQQQDYLGHIDGHIEEMYGGHIVMKAFNGEQKSIEEFDEINKTLYQSAWRSQFLAGLLPPVMNFVSNLGYVAICILGGSLAVRQVITLGDIQAFIQYVRMFTQPITQIANISNIFQQTAASAERVFEFLGEPEEVPDPANPVKLEKVTGGVSFKDVHFGYNPDKIIINDFCADVHPGQKIAIVGPTGAGKTTMVKLLMRFYDVNRGAILVDENDVRDFTRHDLRSMFAMVLQDTWLFNGTVMENIRYGSERASDAEVIEAAKAARVDHFVRTLPGGYNFVLNEETTNVSQGQMQLLTIARAFLANPKILIWMKLPVCRYAH